MAYETPAAADDLRSADPNVVAKAIERHIYNDNGLTLEAAFALSTEDIKYVNNVAGGQKAVNYVSHVGANLRGTDGIEDSVPPLRSAR